MLLDPIYFFLKQYRLGNPVDIDGFLLKASPNPAHGNPIFKTLPRYVARAL
jgi:hypothetical protein